MSTELGIPAHELKYDIYCPSLLESGSRPRFPVDSRAQSELQKLSVQSNTSAVA